MPKILIAEDNALVRKVLARALASQAYELFKTSNGSDALTVASSENLDLILLDVMMPRKNGWEVLKELRRNSRTRMTPVIMLTGCGVVSDKIGGLGLGADDYITKPFDVSELKARVAGVLRRNQLALSANPLTRLPGAPVIEAEVGRRLREKIDFCFLYADIDHFKSYNDAYGFALGDRVIAKTADILLESLEAGGEEDGLVGHIGGDDFVVVTSPERAPQAAQRIAARFDSWAPRFYKPSDSRRGFLWSRNRRGRWERFPLVSLSIGIATSRGGRLGCYAKVVEIASELKAFCKARTGRALSRFAFDRRRGILGLDKNE